MALVSYAASDSDSNEEIEEFKAVKTVDIISQTENANIFNKLPLPTIPAHHTDLEEVQDEFLLKKEVPTEKPNDKKPIRIFAPSLKDVESDDDEDHSKSKKPKVSAKNCGLFAILPPPKQTVITARTFVPQSVQKKTKSEPVKVVRAAKPATITEVHRLSVDSDECDDISVEEFDLSAWKQVCARKTKPEVKTMNWSEEVDNEDEYNTAPEPAKPYDGLDNEAFKKLVGSSNIRRENIKLIDINEAEVLTGEDILRSKALTDPAIEPPKTDGEEISAISRKKHHITYLAQQAKANEQDLKNRWAANRYTRKQTQAKYGF